MSRAFAGGGSVGAVLYGRSAVHAQLCTLSYKNRRNRLRDPALQNPEVFLSGLIMELQSHLSNGVMRDQKDERAALSPGFVARRDSSGALAAGAFRRLPYSGNVTVNTDPAPGVLRTSMRPPIYRTMPSAMESPSPVELDSGERSLQ